MQKTKTQISCAVYAQLISAFVFTSRIVQIQAIIFFAPLILNTVFEMFVCLLFLQYSIIRSEYTCSKSLFLKILNSPRYEFTNISKHFRSYSYNMTDVKEFYVDFCF